MSGEKRASKSSARLQEEEESEVKVQVHGQNRCRGRSPIFEGSARSARASRATKFVLLLGDIHPSIRRRRNTGEREEKT